MCRILAKIDPEGARLEDYARLLRTIADVFPSAHAHLADGLSVVYVGQHERGGESDG